MRRLLALTPAFALAACADGGMTMGALLAGAPGQEEQAVHQVCPAGETTFGVDVSKYQGDIDWNAAAGAGVKFAFIRVSDGLGYHDEYYDANWAGARDAGVLRGTYQFFRSDEDPIAQADYLLQKMGTLGPNDLPPVADVESTDGVDNATRADKLQQWLDHVEQGSGVTPIIYTGGYFWQDNVGADFSRYPLWHAGYTGGTCPSTLPNQWSDWAFWQFTSTGPVAGISANVDQDRFNGTVDQLTGRFGGGEAVCGDGFCSPGESHDTCADDCQICETLKADGGVVSEDTPCFTGGGPPDFLRHVSDAGEGGSLIWTHTTSEATEANFGEWQVLVAEPGHYRVEAYTDAAYAQSHQSVYVVNHAGGSDSFTVDQTAADGWNVVADDLVFDGAGPETVHLSDNTGEDGSTNTQQVFDAIRLTRLDAPGEGEGETAGEGEGEGDPNVDPGHVRRVALLPPASAEGGCAQTSPTTAAPLFGALVMLAIIPRKARRRRA